MTSKEIVDALLHLAQILISWPSIVIAFFIIFRRPLCEHLPGLVKRLRIAELGDAKLEFAELKTLDTPVGKTNVSAIPAKASRIPFGGFYCSYLSTRHSFRISWPSDTWTASIEKGMEIERQLGLPPTFEVPLFISRKEPIAEIHPNVNVVFEQVGAIQIVEYLTRSVQLMQGQGWIVLTSSMDETTQSGVLVYLNTTSSERKLYQFARVMISAGTAYVVTASQLPPDDLLGQQLRNELLNILNSFQVVV